MVMEEPMETDERQAGGKHKPLIPPVRRVKGKKGRGHPKSK